MCFVSPSKKKKKNTMCMYVLLRWQDVRLLRHFLLAFGFADDLSLSLPPPTPSFLLSSFVRTFNLAPNEFNFDDYIRSVRKIE